MPFSYQIHTHTIHSQAQVTLSSTHIIIVPFVVLVFGLDVDGKLGQKGALENGKDKAVRGYYCNSSGLRVEDLCQLIHSMSFEIKCVIICVLLPKPDELQ